MPSETVYFVTSKGKEFIQGGGIRSLSEEDTDVLYLVYDDGPLSYEKMVGIAEMTERSPSYGDTGVVSNLNRVNLREGLRHLFEAGLIDREG